MTELFSKEELETAAACVPGLMDRFGWIPQIALALKQARNRALEEAALECEVWAERDKQESASDSARRCRDSIRALKSTLLAGALAWVLSSLALAQAPDLSGEAAWVLGDGTKCSTDAGKTWKDWRYCVPHGLMPDYSLPPTTYDYTEKGAPLADDVCYPSQGSWKCTLDVPQGDYADDACFPGQGSEWEQRSQPSCGEVTILRGSR